MLTFNIRARNGNYYRGHKPSNKYGAYWGDKVDALTLSIEQARQFIEAAKWLKNCDIVITLESEPISDERCQRELFCLKGGRWFDFEEVK